MTPKIDNCQVKFKFLHRTIVRKKLTSGLQQILKTSVNTKLFT